MTNQYRIADVAAIKNAGDVQMAIEGQLLGKLRSRLEMLRALHADFGFSINGALCDEVKKHLNGALNELAENVDIEVVKTGIHFCLNTDRGYDDPAPFLGWLEAWVETRGGFDEEALAKLYEDEGERGHGRDAD